MHLELGNAYDFGDARLLTGNMSAEISVIDGLRSFSRFCLKWSY